MSDSFSPPNLFTTSGVQSGRNEDNGADVAMIDDFASESPSSNTDGFLVIAGDGTSDEKDANEPSTIDAKEMHTKEDMTVFPPSDPHKDEGAVDSSSLAGAFVEPMKTLKRKTRDEESSDLPASKSFAGDTRRDYGAPILAQKSLDLLDDIPNMYRVLDLVSEQGSGGLVDKIIISQESFGRFMNVLCPGAYVSVTKVDFAALDKVSIQPIGIYGSKSEIVKFLFSAGVIDESLSNKLLRPLDDAAGQTEPCLRSGLYALTTHSEPAVEKTIHVIYWPEDTTWDDNASGSVARNRVTFMRYLTKIADQIIVLISEQHANAIVWQDSVADDVPEEADEEFSDRLFTFEVAKTTEQEEDVIVKQGFSIEHPCISPGRDDVTSDIDPQFLQPRLLRGETRQALVRVDFVPATDMVHRFHQEYFTLMRLARELKGSVRLGQDISEDAIRVMIENGLAARAPDICGAWKERVLQIRREAEEHTRERTTEMHQQLDAEKSRLQYLVQSILVEKVLIKFPMLNGRELGDAALPVQSGDTLDGYWQQLVAIYPRVQDAIDEARKDPNLTKISDKDYQEAKKALVMLDGAFQERADLSESSRRELVEYALKGDWDKVSNLLEAPKKDKSTVHRTWHALMDRFLGGTSTVHSNVSNSAFLADLEAMIRREPQLTLLAFKVTDLAHVALQKAITRRTITCMNRIRSIQEMECRNQLRKGINFECEKLTRDATMALLEKLASVTVIQGAPDTLVIEEMHANTKPFHHESYLIAGHRDYRTDPMLRHTVLELQLTESDKHKLRLDADYVPTPKIHERSAFSYEVPLSQTILLDQLLENGKYLLIIGDEHHIKLYLETPATIGNALQRSAHGEKKTFNRDRLGERLLFAFDEAKRLLSVYSDSKGQRFLHIFTFDEAFATLQGLGSPVNLSQWYDSSIRVSHIAFVCGTEELVLVDDAYQARIFSLVTQQFRPSSLQLPRLPSAIFSSPDASCLIVAYTLEDHVFFRAYHWSSFGSNDGIEIAQLQHEQYTVTSLVKRGNVHLIGITPESHRCDTLALDIKSKVTEFMFKHKGDYQTGAGDSRTTLHNCLLDCHAEVWTRFPVVPAVRRHTVESSQRRSRLLLFVTHRDHPLYQPYFDNLIAGFEKSTRKPVQDELKNIQLMAVAFDALQSELDTSDRLLSQFSAGEWLVEILCLIPIHIAVARENRFVPLKDGVWSAELERSLLGADVGQIIDSLSFGWYESLFQSYMAKKPVRVVSSMGEQSVGKSFALNHLVDTSFAGSAMRTTEGVWMSVSPTDKELIVALDFEGVHSIERSAQEDTLLVLFNVAISNLVLFRNNFALSRDITGLFQSFQSSASVLDPAANPSLFQSTLVIIIKDVVDSDKAEITREFSLKFQDIVQMEQGSNFISRLHRGRLNIIPWPVIESKQFYTLFNTVRRLLDREAITHVNGNVFLQTLKTLMAKLKANDWGALSQNLASHRAQLLRALLPKALASGFIENDLGKELLKDFDSNIVLEGPDTQAQFFILTSDNQADEEIVGRERSLTELQQAWDQYTQRHSWPEPDWAQGLIEFMNSQADMRIAFVREWIIVNLSRFGDHNTDIESLRRQFDAMAIDLKASIRVCSMQCTQCHLTCLRGRLHEGTHDCMTDHSCTHVCQFQDDHTSEEPCGLPAGHAGAHICNIKTHRCGKPCQLSDRKGCQQLCTKVIEHEDAEHMCSATAHECGEPCALSSLRLSNGDIFTCAGSCCIPSNREHDHHICENRSCPFTCVLCKRLCSEVDHLHGLDPDAVHLCGQEHPCSALCAASGTCFIETAPQSVEATFTGRHETFQYTKYSQNSRRLPCAIPIPAGFGSHNGPHSHSQERNPFHYCEERCDNCGYFCTLPFGHRQQEHETSHGSMSKTQWAIDGPDGTVYELDGRRFGSTDEGAPLLCSLVCRSMGRHVHIDYCRAAPGTPCNGPDVQHIQAQMTPNPGRAKDWVTHKLFWMRTGFKDPYSQDDRNNFAKCDAMCSDPDHTAAVNQQAQPSYCTLPMFHPRQRLDQAVPGGLGYVSNDGHTFSCKNPALMQQAFHVIFVIDRSGSMIYNDRLPLPNALGTARITRRHNNRLGAVYSSLHAFWIARHAVVAAAGNAAGNAAVRRDAYSVLLFDSSTVKLIENDFNSTPDELLDRVLTYSAGGGTNYTDALRSAQSVMEQHWSSERSPVIIFLSDGECSVSDHVVQDLCRRAVALGKALSLHAVSFGPRDNVLQRMAHIALDAQNGAPPDPLHPPVPSQYTQAIDTIRLAETFLGIADSLQKPRASLLRG